MYSRNEQSTQIIQHHCADQNLPHAAVCVLLNLRPRKSHLCNELPDVFTYNSMQEGFTYSNLLVYVHCKVYALDHAEYKDGRLVNLLSHLTGSVQELTLQSGHPTLKTQAGITSKFQFTIWKRSLALLVFFFFLMFI